MAADGVEAVSFKEDMDEFSENLRGMSESWLANVPDHVVGLTFSDIYDAHTILLDTKFGAVHVCDSPLQFRSTQLALSFSKKKALSHQ